MAKPTIDLRKAAQVLVDAHFTTDKEAAKKHGITSRTVQNYRKKLDQKCDKFDPELSAVFVGFMEEVAEDEKWDWMSDAVHAGVKAAIECFKSLDKRNPESLRVIRETIEMLTSYELTKKVIEAEIEIAAPKSTQRAAASTQGIEAPRAYA